MSLDEIRPTIRIYLTVQLSGITGQLKSATVTNVGTKFQANKKGATDYDSATGV